MDRATAIRMRPKILMNRPASLTSRPVAAPRSDLPQEALRSCRSAFLAVALFSAAVNVLMLAGSIYMLQVYDRVLPSRSVPTLVALSLAIVALYLLLGLFDGLRQRIMVRIGVALDQALAAPVLKAVLRAPLRGRSAEGLQLSRDLDTVRGFLSGLGPTTLFDLPWMPLYVAACFLLHPLLGWTLVGGALILTGLTVATELATRGPTRDAARGASSRAALLETGRRNAEVVAALGMEDRVVRRFGEANAGYAAANLRASDVASSLGTASKTVRFILQSALLGVGAWLVIQNEASHGVMIAASIISSRALAPVELAIANWRPFLAARQAWQRLGQGLPPVDIDRPVAPDAAQRRLTVEHLVVVPPGAPAPVLQGISFALAGGDGLAIIGPSASGKSTLARALVGVWPAAKGEVRLDGATLEQWPAETRGAMIGYLPQDIQLFDGTVAENIARFEPRASEQAVIAAARAAGAYDMILGLPNGFGTPVGEAGGALSGGQRQRVALARALYKDPFLVVLDEPNSNLDAEGDAALTEAVRGIRARGGIVIVVAHRPSALTGVDLVLALAGGQVQSFGPKDDVLRKALAGAPKPAAQPAAAPRLATVDGKA